MLPYHKTLGIAIKSRKHGETSKLLTIYTKDYGKINAIAKGARKLKSRFGCSLELFTESKMMLYKKEAGELYLVSQTLITEHFRNLCSDMKKFTVASVVSEFMFNFTPNAESNPSLYNLYKYILSALDSGNEEDKVLLMFMVKFLTISGYKLHLKSCSSCGSKNIEKEENKFISAKFGGALCEECAGKDFAKIKVAGSTMKLLEYFQQKDFEGLSKISFTEASKKEVSKVIEYFLEYYFESKLKSLSVMESIAKYSS